MNIFVNQKKALEGKIAQSYVLGSLVKAANRYMNDLTDRYVLKVVPGTFVVEVEDAYQGYVSRPDRSQPERAHRHQHGDGGS